MPPSAIARVPASTANLGPGFDCLGLALDLYNTVNLSVTGMTEVSVRGEGTGALPLNQQNLVLRAANRLAEQAGVQVPGWRLEQENEIPLARGLGSSSAAIVGGLVAANELLRTGASPQELLELATAIEGHPDNVAPALFGGLTVCAREGETVHCVALQPPAGLQVAVAIPMLEMSTEAARAALPNSYSREDTVYNLTHAALTVAALVEGRFDLLRAAMQDRVHEPYRLPLMPRLVEVMEAAQEAGALAAVLSGSGPSVAAFCDRLEAAIEEAMVEAFARIGHKAEVRWLQPAHGALDPDWTMRV
ncbi:MAG: homoserine kinase [candidate division WS1 bacterium]|jgi:homoserine kinase|nr:homoserine kinase [candidate division WS1 bacterium]